MANKRSLWSEIQMKNAIKAVLEENVSQKTAAKQFNVPRQTLRRYLEKTRSGQPFHLKEKLGRKTVLTVQQEKELVNVLLDMEQKLFGVSIKDVKKHVFYYCSKNGIENPFNQNKRQAGKDWLKDFLKRNPELSIRKPEAVSIQRAIGFNKHKVKIFFDNLKKLLFSEKGTMLIPPENIYNVDESGFTTVHKPGKVLAKKGKKSVGAMTSGEKGKNVTVVCCVSAVGHYIPPLFIFPRVRLRPEFLDRGPVGAIGAATPSGWINEEVFEKWFDHFLKIVVPGGRSDPVLLILDGHTSHTRNLGVIEKAKKNNVILLSLPSHCTHKLQPLDVAVFKSINIFYDQAAETWMTQHPGRTVTEKDIPELFKSAYEKGATIKNAASGFAKCGIFPFNPEVFTDEDFVAAENMSRKNESESARELQDHHLEEDTEKENNYVSQPQDRNFEDLEKTPEKEIATTSTVIDDSVSFTELMPVPVERRTAEQRKRKVAHSEVLTSTPYKEELKQALEKKQKPRIPRRKELAENSKQADPQKHILRSRQVLSTQNDKSDDAACIFCEEMYSITGGTWIRCMTCQQWAHTDCAGVDLKTKIYVCDLCQ